MRELLFLVGLPLIVAACAAWANAASRTTTWVAASLLAVGLGLLWIVDSPKVPTFADAAVWCLIGALPIGFAFFVSRLRQVGQRPIVVAIAAGSAYVAALLFGANVAMELGILVP